METTFQRITNWCKHTLASFFSDEAETGATKVTTKEKRYPINLQIGNQNICINTTPSTEALYRTAAKQLHDRYNSYKEAYPTASSENIYALLAMTMAVKEISKGR